MYLLNILNLLSEVGPKEIPDLYLFVFLKLFLHVEIHSVDLVFHMTPEIKVMYTKDRQACQTNHNLLFCHQTPFLELSEYHLECGKLMNHAEIAHIIIILLQSAWRNILMSVWHIYLVCFFIEYGPNISFLYRSHCTSHAKLHIMKMNFLD